MVSRRNFVTLGGSAVLATALGPQAAFAGAGTERRFVFIIQRGAADGLSLLAPVGDPAFASQRGALAEDVASSNP